MKALAEVARVKLPSARVVSRVARKHYGTECMTSFKEGIHDPKMRFALNTALIRD